MLYLYAAWFRDLRLPPDDQDYEWVACFLIEADDAERAIAWGDDLAKRRSARAEEPLVSSSIRVATDRDRALPLVRAGVDATDDYIGW